jgi:hypothetical protein
MKGFVFIFGSEIALRFIACGTFKALEKHHDLTYIVLRSEGLMPGGGIDDYLASELQKIEWVPFHPERLGIWRDLFSVSCILNRKKSPSFEIRLSCMEKERFRELEQLARPDVYKQMRDTVEQNIGLNPDIMALVNREKPDFFVLPSGLLDYITDDVLQIANETKIPTLLLVLGWDNLSSKGLLYHKPTMIGVWGEQSKSHAIDVQEINANRVFVIGAPHFEYFRVIEKIDTAALRTSWGVPQTGKLILFAGALRQFDETQLLQEIDQAINRNILPKMHVIYRPHPWRDTRQFENNFFDHEWHNISLDPALVNVYHQSKDNIHRWCPSPDNFLFSMNHLSNLYQTVDAVITPMSTVLLESISSGLPTMAVTFGDNKHSLGPDKVSKMLHFQDLYKIPEITFCRRKDEFFQSIEILLSQIGDSRCKESLRSNSRFFAYQDHQIYGDRVSILVDTMLNRVKNGETVE